MSARHLLLLLFLVLPFASRGEEGALRPDYGVAQFAGQIGFLSVGGGKSFHDGEVEAELLLGYVPAALVGEDVFALALKARYLYSSHHVAGQRITPYLGLGVHYYLGDQYRIHANQPDKYYSYLDWHVMPHVGLNVTPQGGASRDMTVYVEAGVLDSYLLDYLNSTEYLSPVDLISVSLGIRVPLE